MIRDCLLIIIILYIIYLKSCINKCELESFQQSQQNSPDITSLNNIVNILSTAVDSNNRLTIEGAAVPIGTVIIWFKNDPPQPENCWKLCNGTNGAPDLKNKFILYKDENVGTTPPVTVPLKRHYHGTDSKGNHRHKISGNGGGWNAVNNNYLRAGLTDRPNDFTTDEYPASEEGAHTHSISTEGNTDDTWQLQNYPPHIVVKYYIRVNPTTRNY